MFEFCVKVSCPRCGEVGYLNARVVRGRVYFWVVHRGVDGRFYAHYIGRPNVLEVPIDWREWLAIAPYFGGRRFVIPYLARFVPPHRVYVEVFGGMASFLLNKPKSPIEVYNDIDGDLVRLFMTVRDRWLLPSRELFERWRDAWVRGWRPEDDCEFAAVMIYLHRMSYGGLIVKGFAGGTSSAARAIVPGYVGAEAVSKGKLMLDSHERVYRWLKRLHQRLSRVMIERLDYRECIRKYDSPETFFYLDPPHIGNESSYDGGFTPKDHERLYNLLTKVKGRWLLKYTYHPWVMEKYRDFSKVVIEYVKSSTIVKNSSRVKGKYVLIANYELPPNMKLLSRGS